MIPRMNPFYGQAIPKVAIEREQGLKKPADAWHLDKRIPLSLLLLLFMHLVTLIGWASYLEARVTRNEATINRLSDMGERLARIEERVNDTREEVILLRNALRERK